MNVAELLEKVREKANPPSLGRMVGLSLYPRSFILEPRLHRALQPIDIIFELLRNGFEKGQGSFKG
jgi:hypothetical protein